MNEYEYDLQSVSFSVDVIGTKAAILKHICSMVYYIVLNVCIWTLEVSVDRWMP